MLKQKLDALLKLLKETPLTPEQKDELDKIEQATNEEELEARRTP